MRLCARCGIQAVSGWPVRPIALLALPLLLAGCVMSLQEVRQTTPMRTATAPGDYWQLANCVLDGMQSSPRSLWTLEPSGLRYQIVQRVPQQQATLTGFLEQAAYQAPMVDLTFTQRGADVAVESRWGGFGDSAGPRRIDEKTWPIVERCAGAKVMPSAAHR